MEWNKYRSEISDQTKTNNLNYVIYPTFSRVNRCFVLSVENEEDRTSFSKCYTPKVEIKDFNVPIKRKEESYKKMSKNNDYITINPWDYD